MPDANLNYTANGWPYLDDQNFIDITDDYSLTLANKLETDVTQLSQDAAAAAAAANALAGTFLVGTGRPDQPATTPYTATDLNALPVGTEYKSTNGPQGAWKWRKTGATTWTVTDGDTGWRQLTPTVEGASGSLAIRRDRSSVQILGGTLKFASWAGTANITIPPGFRAPYTVYGTWDTAGVPSKLAYVLAGILSLWSGPPANMATVVRLEAIQFFTNDDWPTILPV